MNEEAFKTMYSLAQREGYKKTEEEFKTLLNTNEEALSTMYSLAQKEGYKKSIDDFKGLLGVSSSGGASTNFTEGSEKPSEPQGKPLEKSGLSKAQIEGRAAMDSYSPNEKKTITLPQGASSTLFKFADVQAKAEKAAKDAADIDAMNKKAAFQSAGYESFRMKQLDKTPYDEKRNEVSKEVEALIPEVDAIISPIIKQNVDDSFVQMAVSGVKKVDIDKVANLTENIAKNANIEKGTPAYSYIYNKVKEQADFKQYEEQVNKKFDTLFNNSPEGKQLAEQVKAFEQKQSEIKNKIEYQQSQEAFVLNKTFEEQAKQFNTQINEETEKLAAPQLQVIQAQLQERLNAGMVTEEEANKQLQESSKQVYEKLFEEEKQRKLPELTEALNKYMANIEEVNKKYNKRFEEEQSNVRAKYEEEIKAMKLDEKSAELYTRAYKEALGEKVSQQKAYENATKYYGVPFFLTTAASFGSGIKGISSALGSQAGVEWGDKMEQMFQTNPEALEKVSDIFDLRKIQKSTGNLLGRMTPSLTAAAATGILTGGMGLPATASMTLASVAAFAGESLDMAGTIKDEVLRETGNAAKAQQAYDEMLKGQAMISPLYAFEALPLFGKIIKGSGALKFATIGATEFATELPQEFTQGAMEESIRKTSLEGTPSLSKTGESLTMERLGETALEIAPVIFMGGGQAVSSARATISEMKGKSIAEKAKAQLANMLPEASNQFLFDITANHSANTTRGVLAYMRQADLITDTELKKRLEVVDRQEGYLNALPMFRSLKREEMPTYNKLMEELDEAMYVANKSKGSGIELIAKDRLKKVQEKVGKFLDSGESDLVSMEFKRGGSFVFTPQQAVDYLERDEVKEALEAGELKIKGSGELSKNLVEATKDTAEQSFTRKELEKAVKNLKDSDTQVFRFSKLENIPDSLRGEAIEKKSADTDVVIYGKGAKGLFNSLLGRGKRAVREGEKHYEVEVTGAQLREFINTIPNENTKESNREELLDGVREEGNENQGGQESQQLREEEVTPLKDKLNKRVSFTDASGNTFEGDLFQDGQRVILDIGNGKERDLGNINEDIQGIELVEPTIIPSEFGYTYNGKDEKIPKGLNVKPDKEGLKSIRRDKEGIIKRIVVVGEDGKTYNIKGQEAQDLAYDMQMQLFNKEGKTILEQNETIAREIEDVYARQIPKTTQEGTTENTQQDLQGTNDRGVTPKPDVSKQESKVEPDKSTKEGIDNVAKTLSTTPKNIKDLYKIGREMFGLNKIQALAQSVVMDRVVSTMAKRAGISKEEMYGRLKFEKASEKDIPQGVLLQVDAFHGSPYLFDKFSLEKIGTGEGAQAFGWGLYFTDLESIARNYATTLRRDAENYRELSKQEAINLIKSKKDGFEFIDGKVSNDTEGISYVEERYKNNDPLFTEKGVSNLYKVILHKGKEVGEYTWLEWDKPLSEKVLTNLIGGLANSNKIKNIRIDSKKEFINNEKDELIKIVKKHNLLLKERDDLIDIYLENQSERLKNELDLINSRIKDSYDKLPIGVKKKKVYESVNLDDKFYSKNKISYQDTSNDWFEIEDGEQLYKILQEELGGDKQASLFLLENDIDGIKYPAESISRGATSDTARGFNYVVFDENAVSIEEVIKFQKDAEKAQGAVMVGMDGQAVIYALTDPNVSTPLHELAHVFEHYLTDEERKQVLNWTGQKDWTTETSEKFARGFEKYLSDGKSPIESLQKVFDNFKQWLTDIYNGIKGSEIDITLNEEMQGIYDKMLDKQEISPEENLKSAWSAWKSSITDTSSGIIFDPRSKVATDVALTKALINYVASKLKAGAYGVQKFAEDFATLTGEALENAKDVFGFIKNKAVVENYKQKIKDVKETYKAKIQDLKDAAKESKDIKKVVYDFLDKEMKDLGLKGLSAADTKRVARALRDVTPNNYDSKMEAVLNVLVKQAAKNEVASILNEQNKIRKKAKSKTSNYGSLSNRFRIFASVDITELSAKELSDYVELLDQISEGIGNMPQLAEKVDKFLSSLEEKQEVEEVEETDSIKEPTAEEVEDALFALSMIEINEDMLPHEKEIVSAIKSATKEQIEILSPRRVKQIPALVAKMNSGIVNPAVVSLKENLAAVKKATAIAKAIDKIKNLGKIKIRLGGLKSFNLSQIDAALLLKDNTISRVLYDTALAEGKLSAEKSRLRGRISRAFKTTFGEVSREKKRVAAIKVQLYKLALQEESNKGVKGAHSVKDLYEATLGTTTKKAAYAEKYGEGSYRALEELYNKYKDEKGNVSSEKVFEDMTAVEKKLLKEIDAILAEAQEMVVKVGSIDRGLLGLLYDNYTPLNTDNETYTTTEERERLYRSGKSAPVAGAIHERQAAPSAIRFDIVTSVLKSVDGVMTDFYLGSPLREEALTMKYAEKIVDKKGDKNKAVVFQRLYNVIAGQRANWLVQNKTQESKFLKETLGMTYRYLLGTIKKFVTEGISNTAGVFAYDTISGRGFTRDGLILNAIKSAASSSKTAAVIKNVGSAQEARLVQGSSLGRYGDNIISDEEMADFDYRNRSLSARAITAIKTLGIPQAFVAKHAITTWDILYSRGIFMSELKRSFKESTGESVDLEKLASGNKEYMDKYKEALDKARFDADLLVTDFQSTQNAASKSFNQTKAKNTNMIYASLNYFMLSFNLNDAAHTQRAVVQKGLVKGSASVASVLVRQAIYQVAAEAMMNLGFKYLVEMFGDDDDKEKAERLEKLLEKDVWERATIAALSEIAFLRYFGGVARLGIYAVANIAYAAYKREVEGENYEAEDIYFSKLGEDRYAPKNESLLQGVSMAAPTTTPIVDIVTAAMRANSTLNKNEKDLEKQDIKYDEKEEKDKAAYYSFIFKTAAASGILPKDIPTFYGMYNNRKDRLEKEMEELGYIKKY